MPAQGWIQKNKGEGGRVCTLSLPLGCRASSAISRRSLHHPASRFKLQSELVSCTHAQDGGFGPYNPPPPPPPPPPRSVPAAKLKVDLLTWFLKYTGTIVGRYVGKKSLSRPQALAALNTLSWQNNLNPMSGYNKQN